MCIRDSNGSFTALVSLDISAAFDTLDHSILSSHLQSDFSIEGTTLAWIQSYISGRRTFVQVGRSASCQQPCIAGVPQGSILGSLLFAAYYISLIGCVVGQLGIKHHEYADDTQLYVEMTEETLSTGSRTASIVSSLGFCAIICFSTEASRTPLLLGQLNVMLGRRSQHSCVSLRVVLQSVTA